MTQLTCNDLALGYEGKIVAEHLSFSVCSGDYLCVVGENGSGKSTLIKALLRLKAPMARSIITDKALKGAEIGYLPQQTAIQKDFPASVREIVRSGCLNKCGMRPFYSRREKALAGAAMEKLGISGLSGRCYRELSGGQQQRVLLARALCAAGKILILDEPAAGLDPGAALEMYELLAKLNAEDKMTVIMVSHDIASALRYASHILHVGRSQRFFGTKDEYLLSGAGKAFALGAGGEKI